MRATDNIFLVGMMGAGKSSLGSHLAKRLELDFVDTDREIEASSGVSASTIFDIEGEAGFRRRESRLLASLVASGSRVIATGGGIVLDAENRRVMAASGIVVYLNVSPQVLWERLRRDRKRPLLRVADPQAEIHSLHGARDSLYRAVADFVVDCDGDNAQQIVATLEREICLRRRVA